MTSLELTPRLKKRQLRDGDWEPLKDLVYTMYIVNGMELDEVLVELQRQGLDVNKGNLESKLRNWGIRKKLQPNIWRYVDRVIRDRKTSFMRNTVVILSGRRIPKEKIKSEITRHNPPTWSRLIPSPPPENIPLYLCTPRGSSTSLVTSTPDAVQYGYPKGLPWFQFLECDFGVVLRAMEFLPKLRKTATSPLPEPEAIRQLLQIVQRSDVVVLSNTEKSRLLPPIFEQIVRRCLGITIRSEHMAMQLLARKSVDRLAAQFDMVLPQAYPDENLRRATTLAGGSAADIQVELLKILLFLVSNRLILNKYNQLGGRDELPELVELDDARQLIALCQFSGLSRLHTLRKLVSRSHRSLTMTAIIDALFRAAILTGAAGFVRNLLKADCRLRPDKMTDFHVFYDRIGRDGCPRDGTGLEFALAKHDESLVKVLVDAGAELPSSGPRGWSLLAMVIYDDFPSTLIQMLRQRGAGINQFPINEHRLEPVHAAFMTGNLHLIEGLVAEGADLNRRYRGLLLTSNGAIFEHPFASSDYFHVLGHVDDMGCLGFAASFHSATMTTESERPGHLWDSFAKDQDKALELCRMVHSKYRLQMDLSDDRMTADAMIFASARGYIKVIAFLYNEFSASVNVPSGYLSPLYAAVGWKQVEAARLLLRLGAYPCPPMACTIATPYIHYDGTGMAECPAPSLLQLATAQGSCELVELLIEHEGGADVNEEREIALKGNKLHWPPRDKPSRLNYADIRHSGVSVTRARLQPFQLAVLSKEWDVGLTLLRHGATATANDLFDVAVEGQLVLVERLLDMGIDPSKSVKSGITAYEAALSNGHGVVAARLATAGGGGPIGDFASLFRIPDVGYIKARVPLGLLREPWKICRDRDRRSYLENAILSRDKEVIMMALGLDAAVYDSAALCAEALSLMESGQETASPLLMELLRRRNLDPDGIHVNPALENYAVSIAAWHACSNILVALLTFPPLGLTQSLATLTHPRVKLRQSMLNSKTSPTGYDQWSHEGPRLNSSNNWHLSPFPTVSPLLFAVGGKASEQVTEMLLEAGYKPDGFTLRAAILRNLSFRLIERMLESCDDVDTKCAIVSWDLPEVQTPLFAAVRVGRADIVKALLARHADINAIHGKARYTVLHYAICGQRLPIVDLLLDAGAEVNDPARSRANGFEITALQAAAGRGLIGLVQRLITCGANLNARRPYPSGCTALEEAATRGRLDTVHLLLGAGTDTEGYGRVQFVCATALASSSGYSAVVELLKSHREWTEDDFTIWNQLYPGTRWMMDPDRYLRFVHPLELSPGELVVELAETPTYATYPAGIWEVKCYATMPRVCDQMVARLAKERATEVAQMSHDTTMAVTEEAARFAMQAIRKWSEQSSIPLPCWSLWNLEHGAAQRPVEACNVCGLEVWYYFPCSLQSRAEEVAEVVAQALSQWLPCSSWLDQTSNNGGDVSEDLGISPPIDTEAFQESPEEYPTFGFDEWDDMTIDDITTDHHTIDHHTIDHGPPASYDNTPMPNSCDDGFPGDGGDDFEEEWRIILAENGINQEPGSAPMDCGR
ncbi:uncharacterized protein B0H64DRAFT_468823 [Chaetomium fimeti]|uniref:Clr5 domain-containing protein n=1 Tax=Chaetomium fimeti TaxID=1854472 RepID=A0AAE0LP00_9PEZI|nr:hypothetical protein B0H64DRAFT_468823 [Chaetomium fimeti]